MFRDLALQLETRVGKPKSTPIFPLLFHLYNSHGLLTDEEETDYKTTQELARYRIIPKPKSKPKSKDEGQANTSTASLV